MRTDNPQTPARKAFRTRPVPSEQDFVLHLRAYENSAVVARRLTGLALDVWRWQGDRDGPLTVVGELFANACQAAPGQNVRLRVAWTSEGVRLECRDPAPCRPPAPSLPDDLSENGRGLYLIAALSRRYGIAAGAPPELGKTLWAVLPHPAGA